MTNPRATWGGCGSVMGWARYTWRVNGVPVERVAYGAGLTERDARATDAWAGVDPEFIGGEWLSDAAAAAHQREAWPSYTAWRESVAA